MPSSFPPPVSPTTEVDVARGRRRSGLRRATLLGILIRSLVIALELAGVWLFGSAMLFVDAFGTVLDVATALLLLLCIQLAARPPDHDHPFGHGRYEPLAGLQLGLLLALIGALMAFVQMRTLFSGHFHYVVDRQVWLVPLVAAGLLEWVARRTRDTAKRRESPALSTEAKHLRLDALNSLITSMVLLVAHFVPNYGAMLDVIGALFIALLMMLLGLLAARENLHQLMDRTPSQEYFSRVDEAARRIKGVLDTEKIRIMHYGPDAHIDIDIEVDPTMNVEQAHVISQHVRVAIQEEWPQVRDVTVHIEPYYPGDH